MSEMDNLKENSKWGIRAFVKHCLRGYTGNFQVNMFEGSVVNINFSKSVKAGDEVVFLND